MTDSLRRCALLLFGELHVREAEQDPVPITLPDRLVEDLARVMTASRPEAWLSAVRSWHGGLTEEEQRAAVRVILAGVDGELERIEGIS